MSILLNNINKIKNNNRKRIGRGIGSGTGKTSGHGVKGQKARSGVALKLFEGGQTPIHMRLPKKGFRSHCKDSYEVLNIKDVVSAVEKNKISAKTISKEELYKFGLIKNQDSVIKLIMNNEELKNSLKNSDLKIQADFYSKSAKSFAV